MAITTGLLVTCADLNSIGGIRQILITDVGNIATMAPAASNVSHSITELTTSIPWARFEFQNETAGMTVTGTKTNGSTEYIVDLTFFVPYANGQRSAELAALEGGCPVALVEYSTGIIMVIGLSYLYQSQSSTTPWLRNQTTAGLKTIEGGSGLLYSDLNGYTVTMSAKQYELPYEYICASPTAPSVNGITILAGDVTADTE
tara:strand:+ start:44 stop:649 length:606 start_codon:yes stop_codon:yes gene_type:complete